MAVTNLFPAAHQTLQNICASFKTVVQPDRLTSKDLKRFLQSDVTQIPTQRVLELLKSKVEGLSSVEATSRLSLFGDNTLSSKTRFRLIDIPCSCLLVATAIVAGITKEWVPFSMMLVLLAFNIIFALSAQHKFPNPLPPMMARIAPLSRVLRDGVINDNLESRFLVPGDVISVRAGDFISADCLLIMDGASLSVDESLVTGERNLVPKAVKDILYYGSTCRDGDTYGLVIATGLHTRVGKARREQVSQTRLLVKHIYLITGIYISVMVVLGCVCLFHFKRRPLRDGMRTLLAFLIGSIPSAFPLVLRYIRFRGAHDLSSKGAIAKSFAVFEKMAQMDVLCVDKQALVSDRLLVDESSIMLFDGETTKVDALALVFSDDQGNVASSREVKHFQLDVLTSNTISDHMDRHQHHYEMCKGDPEYVITQCDYLSEQKKKEVREMVTKFSEHGFHSMALATRLDGGSWKLICIVPLFQPLLPRVVGILRKIFYLGVDVKIMTTDSLTKAKMVSKRLGIGANIFPSCVFLSGYSDPSRAAIPLKKLVETSSGFCDVSIEDKVDMVTAFKQGKHICGFTGVGDVDTVVLKEADIGISLPNATNSALLSSDLVLSDHGILSIFMAIITGRVIFQQSKTCVCYTISTFYVGISVLLMDAIWNFKFPPILVVAIIFCNYITVICTIFAKTRPSMSPKSLKPTMMTGGAFTGAFIGVYLMTMTMVFFKLLKHFKVFPSMSKLNALEDSGHITTAIYLQMSIVSQASIFVINAQNRLLKERPGFILLCTFVLVQLGTTLGFVYKGWDFLGTRAIGWPWAGAIWCYSFLEYLLLNVIKFAIENHVFGKVKCHKRSILSSWKIKEDEDLFTDFHDQFLQMLE